MHRYFIKISWFIRWLFPAYVWRISSDEKAVYLTFDDGPDPVVTPWVLQELKKYDAPATFFCVGEMVQQHPQVYRQLLTENHAVGNHTYHHFNGWNTDHETYISDVVKAAAFIDSNLFRPPYGRIRSAQAKAIPGALGKSDAQIIMWDVLSADFDPAFTPEQCLANVIDNVSAGSIIVFHDSEKAFPNLRYALPVVLEFLKKEGYILKKIEI
jgi:peptidoglycan-N-acetylglucosamine deacetylase